MVPFLLACGLETSPILQLERKEATASLRVDYLHFGSLALRRFDVLTELQARGPSGVLLHAEGMYGLDLARLIQHSGETLLNVCVTTADVEAYSTSLLHCKAWMSWGVGEG